MLAILSAAALSLAAQDAVFPTLSGEPPLVIAHRGASGTYPEHTEIAFRAAFEQGADILEPDLMMSSDGALIVRHDPYLSTSTDIAHRPEFANRRRALMGREDWWVMDFTAEELQSLRARQVFEDRDSSHDDAHPVLTFDDFLDLVDELQAECACAITTEPEIKLPAEHAAFGLDPLPVLLESLDARGLNAAEAPVIVQSFDAPFLQRLAEASPVRTVMLHSGDEPGGDMNGLGLDEVAGFASGYGAYKGLLLNPDGSSTGVVEAAHALGLEVHAWTHRDDREPAAGETSDDELRHLYALGVDGVFTDFPATAMRIRAEMAGE
ncbi:glycerophosphodiester phosphodiesterase [Glycocaulis profundi]|nr:glycerophosphodiester phosphodiesterase [Glycocaulis profundi]